MHAYLVPDVAVPQAEVLDAWIAGHAVEDGTQLPCSHLGSSQANLQGRSVGCQDCWQARNSLDWRGDSSAHLVDVGHLLDALLHEREQLFERWSLVVLAGGFVRALQSRE